MQASLKYVVASLGLAAILSALPASAQTPVEVTRIIRAVPRAGEWKGWGKYSEPDPEGPDNIGIRDKLTRVKTQPGEPREFSGKVEGLDDFTGAQVGLVSLVDVWWINDAAYEWAPVQWDGSFRITAQRYPDAEKALCLRAPNRPWVFLHANFPANEAAKDVVLRAQPGKRVRISARLMDGSAVRWLAVEPFEAYRSYDNFSQPLAKQRYGYYSTQDGDLIVTLPLEPVALYVSGSGAANCYAIVDPTEADHYEFVLFPAGRIRGVLTRDGKPVAGTSVRLFNDAEPLSVRNSTTNEQGQWQAGGLAPGEWNVTAGDTTTVITLKPGETRDLSR